ncbi:MULTISPECIES: GYDIA family GHMP kinase [Flavobacteriaceae]|uniref:GYDIA family GHMP kinase n=1 Tax=Flavobacteriaceae TaxID=49546 RepID=UPI001492E5AB|nr:MULTISPECIES: GYDIA family GHMP kinase [Allomuricauda]MDC6365578.1 GYDIA family GHMP kinase [Muricauda sp. AC10]
MKKEFYSNGKLLLSGEYAILDGAMGLAIPTKYGQSLKITSNNIKALHWKSLNEKNEIWFQAEFDLKHFEVISSSDKEASKTLSGLLLEAKRQNPDFLLGSLGVQVETKLDFPRDWGLGTSSTLINNLAQWAEVDAYQLLWNAFGGSGYDIACAQHNTPITYQLREGTPHVAKVNFEPSFKESLYFIYLNQKQSSKKAIASYKTKEFNKERLIQDVSLITQQMISASSLEEFEDLMEKHEILLSKILGVPTIKSKLFSDYPGAIKSLGAWGGDFIMVTGNEKTLSYFYDKGYRTHILFSKMLLSST